MNKKLKATVLTSATVVLICQAAHAQYSANDLILGFTKGTANPSQNDYIIDLGNAGTAVGVGGSVSKDLSGLFSATTFNNTFAGGLASGVNMGVAGGNPATSGRDLFITTLRNGLGTPISPGSIAPGSLT